MMKNIDNTKLYLALKSAAIQGEFTAYTPFAGALTDVQKFEHLSWDAIVFYKWYMDDKNYVCLENNYADHIEIGLRVNNFNLLYDYRDNQITIKEQFCCPDDRKEIVCKILTVLTEALNSALCDDDCDKNE